MNTRRLKVRRDLIIAFLLGALIGCRIEHFINLVVRVANL